MGYICLRIIILYGVEPTSFSKIATAEWIMALLRIVTFILDTVTSSAVFMINDSSSGWNFSRREDAFDCAFPLFSLMLKAYDLLPLLVVTLTSKR